MSAGSFISSSLSDAESVLAGILVDYCSVKHFKQFGRISGDASSWRNECGTHRWIIGCMWDRVDVARTVSANQKTSVPVRTDGSSFFA